MNRVEDFPAGHSRSETHVRRANGEPYFRTNPNLLALKGWPVKLPNGRHRRPTLPTWDDTRSFLVLTALLAVAIPVGIALGLGLLVGLVDLILGA